MPKQICPSWIMYSPKVIPYVRNRAAGGTISVVNLKALTRVQLTSRWLPWNRLKGAFLLCGAGYVAKHCIDGVRERWASGLAAAERDAAELQRRNDALLDMYGGRSSLEELEQAVRSYKEK
jgi:hypothetical protein